MKFQSRDRVAARARARRRSAIGRSLAVLAVLAAAGCASTGGAARSTVWREDLGRMTKATISAGVAKIVQKHNIVINRREDQPRQVYYETEWITRAVTAEEELRGVTGARNRILVRGRMLESGFGAGGEAFRVTWEVENEVTSATTTGWNPDAMPEEAIKALRPIFTELSMETRTQVRR
ncbi:MAG: hypothetical protein OXQ94_17040 [Gemmatimonadota bacterium]|nr:hypothetical protein [Gemmatimonadota bacterium]MDE2873386.1 hypothetical protein [Gemmatimonadota bacterium]